MKISQVIVTKTDMGRTGIQWILDPGSDLLSDFSIRLYVSESPESGFVSLKELGNDIVIDPTVTDTYLYGNIDWDSNRTFYFKVGVVNKATSLPIDSVVSNLFDINDGITETIRYAEEILCSMFDGMRSVVWRKRTDTQRCPDCWDPYTKTIEKSNCTTCNGTGYIGGYYDGIEIQMSYELGIRSSVINQTEESISNQTKARASNFPQMRPNDVILNRDTNQRYVVVGVQYTQLPNLATSQDKRSKRSYIVSQMLTLQEVASTDPEYNFNVKI